jgi:predicted dehydrogenase
MFSEKPFAVSAIEHECYLRQSRRVACNYVRLFYGWVRQLREIVSSGVLGRLREIDMKEGGIVGATGKATNSYQTRCDLSGGGILSEKGSHTISVLTYILPEHDFAVDAVKMSWHEGLDVDVRAQIKTTAPFEVRISYHLSLVEPIEPMMVLVFDNATVSIKHIDVGAVLQIESKSSRINVAPDSRWAKTDFQAYYLQWRRVLKLYRGVTTFDAAIESSLATTRLIGEIYCIAASESASAGA